ncbi:ATP-dependent zinc protease family protein [Kangiella shandongensis]|uniref:ATP-dependent zinc protease family protein n=1 Tax=Kangiella shandongensis TaxID=2763258 RepID=UPI001CBFC878|nr:ATP-dependent zinc protease [Kangiella shandongensis]
MTVGWKEEAKLTELKIDAIKVKVDTGAKTSSLHAFDIESFDKEGSTYVTFKTCPDKRHPKHTITCEAKVIDYRKITSSNGQTQLRYVIRSPITIGNSTWNIDITLANRHKMRYKMLLGREAMKNIIVSPQKTYLQSD